LTFVLWQDTNREDGTWRSLVARTLGVREVAGSNPVVPTISINHLRLPALAAVLLYVDTRMSKTEITGIAPLFIVKNVPAALAFYRDRLGFDVTFEGPEPDDIFFGIVRRGGAMIMFKDVGVEPVPNYTRDVKQGIARWDAYVHVPDPDALAAEFSSRKVEFFVPLQDTHDGLRGFELKDADGYVLFFGRPRL
jgi:catechol 2,3-dioxygenase-like lactoylglutathione lyase family enzyme